MKTNSYKIAWVLGTLVLTWCVIVWNFSQHAYRTEADQYLQQKKQLSQERALDLADSINRNLNFLNGIPELHANLLSVSQAAARFGASATPSELPYEIRKNRWTNDPELNEISRLLAISETALHPDMIYVLNAAGDCIAASNWYKPGSPVGMNFAERDFFKKNRLGQNGMQFAVGKTTHIPGLYFSSPIIVNGAFVGAAVVKVDVPNLSYLTKQIEGYITDSNGVIILAHDVNREMSALPGSAVLNMSETDKNQRYLRRDFKISEIASWNDPDFPDLQRIGQQNSPFITSSHSLPEYGLTAYIEEGLPGLLLMQRDRNRYALLSALLGSCLILLLGGGYYYLVAIRHAKEEAQKSEARLKQSQQIAGLGSWELDVVNNRLDWSEEVYKIFEIDHSQFEASYEAFLHAIHPDDRDRVNAAYREHISNKTSYEITHRLLMPDGRIKYVSEQCWSEFDTDGKPVRSIGTVLEITSRKQIEEALRETQLMLQSILNNAPIGIWLVGIDGRYRFVNKTFCDAVGIPEQRFLETTYLPDLLGDAIADRCIASDRACLDDTSNVSRSFETLPFVDGQDHVLDIIKTKLYDESGNVIGVIGISTDVSERIRAENLLRESEAKYRELVDNANVIILRMALDGTITYFNEFAERFFGYTEKEILGRHVVGTIVPPQESGTERDLGQLVHAILSHPEQYAENENENIKRNGQRVYVHWTNRLIVDADGKRTGVLSIGHDITTRKTLEKQQSTSNARLSSILAGFPGGVLVEDESRHITLVNQAFCDLFAIPAPPEALIGYDCAVSIEQSKLLFNDPEQFVSGVTEALAGMQPRLGETLSLKDGRIFSRDYLPVISGQALVGNLWLYRDITQQRQIEAAMREAKELAEHSARAKSEFLANMSHEIRTPMNGIIGLTELALDQPISQEVRNYLNKISSTSQSLLTILNDILDFSKLEAGRMAIEHMPFDLDDVLANLHDMFVERANVKNLECSVTADSTLPKRLIGDALRMQQILANLIGNAIKFTDRGAISLDVQLLSRNDSSARIAFIVRDSGIGIAADDIEKLFRPFSQVDGSITRRFGGTGLGLAISQNLLQLMGGEFKVSSTVGSGTAFSFELTLPIAAEENAPRKPRHRISHEAGALRAELSELGKALEGARILIVEDNEVNQQVVSGFLRLGGMHVQIANNGAEALALLGKHHFDGILMDMHMPVMDGLEATRSIRANPLYAELPVIALSAGVTQSERDSCLAAGMNDFIGKPIIPDVLIRTMTKWIKSTSEATTENPQYSLHAANRAANADTKDDLPGFDLRNIMILLDENRDLLDQMLSQFRKDIIGVPQELDTLLNRHEFSAAEKVMHQLKGTAGNLGAMELHAISTQLDAQLKQGQYSAELLQGWHETYQRTLTALNRHLDASQVSDVATSPTETDWPVNQLNELDRLLSENSYIEETLLRTIRNALPSDYALMFEEVVQRIQKIDYAGAHKELVNLMAARPIAKE